MYETGSTGELASTGQEKLPGRRRERPPQNENKQGKRRESEGTRTRESEGTREREKRTANRRGCVYLGPSRCAVGLLLLAARGIARTTRNVFYDVSEM